MENGSAVLVHFVELIDTTDTLITKNNGTRLEYELLGLGILGHVGSQTDCGAALAGGVDASGRDLVHVVEDLRLGSRGVTDEEAVDLVPEITSTGFGEVLLRAAEELTKNAFLHVLVLPDGRCQ